MTGDQRRAKVQVLVTAGDSLTTRSEGDIVTVELPGDYVIYGYADGLRNLADAIDAAIYDHMRRDAEATARRIVDLTGGAA